MKGLTSKTGHCDDESRRQARRLPRRGCDDEDEDFSQCLVSLFSTFLGPQHRSKASCGRALSFLDSVARTSAAKSIEPSSADRVARKGSESASSN